MLLVLKSENQLKRGAEKCRLVRPKVQIISFGKYAVKGNENLYTVECRRNERGEKIVVCNCKANENGMWCYHAAAAVAVHFGWAKQRAESVH